MKIDYEPQFKHESLSLTITPEIFKRDDWLALNNDQRLLFLMLLSIVDHKGNCRYDEHHPWLQILTHDLMQGLDNGDFNTDLFNLRMAHFWEDFQAIVDAGMIELGTSLREHTCFQIVGFKHLASNKSPYRRWS